MPSDDKNNDLGDLKVLGQKLQGLLEVASEKLESRAPDQEQKSNMHYALLAYLQLVGQVKEFEAEVRDDVFDTVGPAATAKDVVGLKNALNFADWAYDEETSDLKEHLASVNFTLLHHDQTKQVGYVGHYIAINPQEKVALIGVKGSSNVEDLLTDICALSVKHELKNPFCKNGKTEMMCHEGILRSAVQLADVLEPWIQHLFVPLQYKILVCGHSLGAGAACLVVPLLKSRISELRDADDRIKVVAFAAPPVMDHDSAMACAPWTQTIVNNSDVIPRCSLANLEVLVACLFNIQKKMQEKDGSPGEGWEATVSFLKKLTAGEQDKDEMLMSSTEARQMIKSAQEEVKVNEPDSLYVPGRVLVIYENWKDAPNKKGKEKPEEEESKDAEPRVVYSSVTNGTASVLRFIEMDEKMVSDHFTTSYHASVDALIAPLEDEREKDTCKMM